MIKTWQERCKEFDDMHITTDMDIQEHMQLEINELRACIAIAERRLGGEIERREFQRRCITPFETPAEYFGRRVKDRRKA